MRRRRKGFVEPSISSREQLNPSVGFSSLVQSIQVFVSFFAVFLTYLACITDVFS